MTPRARPAALAAIRAGVLAALFFAAGPVGAETLFVIDQLVVNVTSAPGGEGDRVTTLKSGDRVEVLERQGDDTQVQLANGNQGWVKSSYLSADPPLQRRLQERAAEIEKLKQNVTRLEAQLAAARPAGPGGAGPGGSTAGSVVGPGSGARRGSAPARGAPDTGRRHPRTPCREGRQSRRKPLPATPAPATPGAATHNGSLLSDSGDPSPWPVWAWASSARPSPWRWGSCWAGARWTAASAASTADSKSTERLYRRKVRRPAKSVVFAGVPPVRPALFTPPSNLTARRAQKCAPLRCCCAPPYLDWPASNNSKRGAVHPQPHDLVRE